MMNGAPKDWMRFHASLSRGRMLLGWDCHFLEFTQSGAFLQDLKYLICSPEFFTRMKPRAWTLKLSSSTLTLFLLKWMPPPPLLARQKLMCLTKQWSVVRNAEIVGIVALPDSVQNTGHRKNLCFVSCMLSSRLYCSSLLWPLLFSALLQCK